jgi:hypothetical protein
MIEFWTSYGLYLWALTTALVIVALAWLAWTTFGAAPEAESAASVDPTALEALVERVNDLARATPHMQATLGRTLQFCGLVIYTDATGAKAFSLAVANARGDGFVLSSSVRGGLQAKPLFHWNSNQQLSREEQSALAEARTQPETA